MAQNHAIGDREGQCTESPFLETSKKDGWRFHMHINSKYYIDVHCWGFQFIQKKLAQLNPCETSSEGDHICVVAFVQGSHLECNAVTKTWPFDIFVHCKSTTRQTPQCSTKYVGFITTSPNVKSDRYAIAIFHPAERVQTLCCCPPNPAACPRTWAESVCHFGETSSASKLFCEDLSKRYFLYLILRKKKEKVWESPPAHCKFHVWFPPSPVELFDSLVTESLLGGAQDMPVEMRSDQSWKHASHACHITKSQRYHGQPPTFVALSFCKYFQKKNEGALRRNPVIFLSFYAFLL